MDGSALARFVATGEAILGGTGINSGRRTTLGGLAYRFAWTWEPITYSGHL